MHSLDPTEDFAIVLVRRFLALCEHPRTRARVRRMIRDATRHGPDAPRIYRWVNRAVLHPAAPARFRSLSAMKVELVASQLVGVAMARYILELEPMASAPAEEIVRLAAPSIAAALRGEESLTGVVRPATTTEVAVARRRFTGTRAVLRVIRPGARVRS